MGLGQAHELKGGGSGMGVWLTMKAGSSWPHPVSIQIKIDTLLGGGDCTWDEMRKKMGCGVGCKLCFNYL